MGGFAQWGPEGGGGVNRRNGKGKGEKHFLQRVYQEHTTTPGGSVKDPEERTSSLIVGKNQFHLGEKNTSHLVKRSKQP